jgi:N-acetylmuramoyl-L-alanine amidase
MSLVRTLAVLLALTSLVGAAHAPAPPTVVIDPGHDRFRNPGTEPIGPGSAQRKVKDGGGTRGVVSGVPEAVVNLQVSLLLHALLRRAGVRVVLTRTRTAGVSLGNVARARMANRARAALFLRVHADGSSRHSEHGTATLVPALRRGWTGDVYAASGRAGRLLQSELVRALGSRDGGVVERSDLTGFNWADVPAVLVEVGFLTNPAEDRLLTSAAYQGRAAAGLCRGVLRWLGRQPDCGTR